MTVVCTLFVVWISNSTIIPVIIQLKGKPVAYDKLDIAFDSVIGTVIL